MEFEPSAEKYREAAFQNSELSIVSVCPSKRKIPVGIPSRPVRVYWAKVPDLIADAERNLQANVNQKLVLADFVAQWSSLFGKSAGNSAGKSP